MHHRQADAIDDYWAGRFGCSLEQFRQPGWQIIPSDEVDPTRIAVLEMPATTLLRVATEHSDRLIDWSRSRPPEAPRTAEALCEAFSEQEWRVSPSEKVFYLDPARFRPFSKSEVRQLTEEDSEALTRMHRGCSLEEQQAGEVNIDHVAVFGAFVEGQIVAAASLIDQGGPISDVGVLVHRDFRRQGYGRTVVSALCQWGMDHGRIVQYWRLCSNTGSVRIADSLGFTEYGRYQVLHHSVSLFF